MRIDILTLFPKLFESVFSESMMKRAAERDSVKINILNIRNFAAGKHKITDDKPYGGGAGMIMMAQPLVAAIKSAKSACRTKKKRVILLSPQGNLFNQEKAKELSGLKQIVLICGHYGGVDERVLKYVDEEISIGDYVLTGGEIPAMVVSDTVVRLIPGVVGKTDSITQDSLWDGMLTFPAYTRPRNFKGMRVPKVLLSGNHAEIEKWRRKKQLDNTLKKRPDLIRKGEKQ
ncbi:MAG: tRNA (guanine-N(1)-)-methyltransferase [Elusimicrobia bacterium ADurb.Bin231]|nr:MAG: tRNA (guanine-N(1)-)-methyltransferase [Elusimicrobia bacterium ADurb.Bin231]